MLIHLLGQYELVLEDDGEDKALRYLNASYMLSVIESRWLLIQDVIEAEKVSNVFLLHASGRSSHWGVGIPFCEEYNSSYVTASSGSTYLNVGRCEADFVDLWVLCCHYRLIFTLCNVEFAKQSQNVPKTIQEVNHQIQTSQNENKRSKETSGTFYRPVFIMEVPLAPKALVDHNSMACIILTFG